MFDRVFNHYLLYAATDQETLRGVQECFDGVIVPGTLAAFQKQGTGGFVLTLSVSEAGTPYVIDPRFPLFQQRLPARKKSHTDLAEVFKDPSLVSWDRDPLPADFNDRRIDRIAAAWVEFNETYPDSANEKFDKYAQRLKAIGEDLDLPHGRDVEAILPPYFVDVKGDDWRRVSEAFVEAVRSHTDLPVVPVIASETVTLLSDRLESVEGRCVVWVSDLKESDFLSSRHVLSRYGAAIRLASSAGVQPFALYGGFFSVLLVSLGLRGAAHGVGFSESRSWIELPQTGPPVPRFYLPSAHRFVAPDIAQTIYDADRALGGCLCSVCEGRAPLALGYHDLMKHSVAVRASEIQTWSSLPAHEVATAWRSEVDETLDRAGDIGEVLDTRGRSAARTYEHLSWWADALDEASGETTHGA